MHKRNSDTHCLPFGTHHSWITPQAHWTLRRMKKVMEKVTRRTVQKNNKQFNIIHRKLAEVLKAYRWSWDALLPRDTHFSLEALEDEKKETRGLLVILSRWLLHKNRDYSKNVSMYYKKHKMVIQ